MSKGSQIAFDNGTHSVTWWTVPCSLLGGAWRRVFVSLDTPSVSGAYSLGQIRGFDASAELAEHLDTLRRNGVIPPV